MRDFLPDDRPVLVLAPMQDVTDLPFMRVMDHYGGPDVYVTEYFRVHQDSTLHPWILRSITENPSGRPVFAQMIGQDVDALVSSAQGLMEYPVAGIDLNLGCPAPVVCRKDAGGGLLRDPDKIDRILGSLREVIDGRFTVKTRIGYYSEDEFENLLGIFAKHEIDALTIHGRTVLERYSTPVHADCVQRAVDALSCPVIANGNVVDVATGEAYLRQTGAAGLMIGRGAIRNPWIFSQLRAHWAGEESPMVTKRELLEYVLLLFEETARLQRNFEPSKHITRLKKYLKYISQGENLAFEHEIVRVREPDEFFRICREHLDSDESVAERPPEGTKLFCGFDHLLEG